MARFQGAELTQTRFYSPSPEASKAAQSEYYTDLLKVADNIKRKKNTLAELKLKEGWTKRTNAADVLSRADNFSGAYGQYVGIINEQVKHLDELKNNPYASETDQIRYSVQISNLTDRLDSLRTRAQNAAEIAGRKALTEYQGQANREIRLNIEAADTITELLRDKWFNREITGETFDQRLYRFWTGEGGIKQRLEMVINDENASDATRNYAEDKLNNYTDLIAGRIDADKQNPFYNLRYKIENPQDYYDFIAKSDPRKLYRDQKKSGTVYSLKGRWIDLNNYQKQADSMIVIPDPNNPKKTITVPNPAAGRYEIELVDPNDPKRKIFVYFDPNSSSIWGTPQFGILADDDKGGKVLQDWNPKDYEAKTEPQYSFKDMESGDYYVAEGDGFRVRTPQDDLPDEQGKFKFEPYDESRIINRDVLDIFMKENPSKTFEAPVSGFDFSSDPVLKVGKLPQMSLPQTQSVPKFLNTSPNFLQGSSPNLNLQYGLPKNKGISF